MAQKDGRKPSYEPLLTKRDVARWLRVKPEAIDRLIREHGLPAVRIPGNKRDTIRFMRASVDRRLSDREEGLPF